MKNVVISFILFFVMIGAMFISINYLNKVCLIIEKESDKLEELVLQEDWEPALEVTTQMMNEWKRQSKIMPVFLNHTEVDILNNEILKLTQYVKCKNKDESLASTHVVKFYIDNLKSLQKVNIENLF